MDPRSVLLISDSSEWSGHAHDYLANRFESVQWYPWDYGNPHARSFHDWPGTDLLFSFKSDFLIPESMLTKVGEYAINFHPSVPQYRGIGGYRYGLDDGLEEFGSTCHFINNSIDAGTIIDVSRFRIHNDETETSLASRTAAVALAQFYSLVDDILTHKRLPQSDERWGTELYTRKRLAEYKSRSSARASAH
ncbi:formyltransferase family protein [Rhodococcus qingshengii]|uniref:formyltransferase family protein n=1 Tax=Rhodococcus qingshengii TaxID=334542 RepID=UPI00237D0F59|nr:formyltransferase family protein [Rhodococcus qingshengii]WCT05868.1 formyltransferase family protein [Rhodococcus qingshengii]